MRLRARRKKNSRKIAGRLRGRNPIPACAAALAVRGGDERYTHISRHEAMERGDARHLVDWPWKRHGQPGLLVDKVSYSGAGGERYEGCTLDVGQADRATSFGKRVSVREDHSEPVSQEKPCVDPVDGPQERGDAEIHLAIENPLCHALRMVLYHANGDRGIGFGEYGNRRRDDEGDHRGRHGDRDVAPSSFCERAQVAERSPEFLEQDSD